MGSINFYKLFKKCLLPEDLKYVIDSCQIENVEANRNSRVIHMTLLFFKMINRRDVEKIRKLIMQVYELNDVKIKLRFVPELFGEAYFENIISFVKSNVAAANGFFNDCVLCFQDNTLTITLQYGGFDILSTNRCGSIIEQLIAEEFDMAVKVVFDGRLTLEPESPAYQKVQQKIQEHHAAKITPERVPAEKTQQPLSEKPNQEGGRKSTVLYGRAIVKGEDTPMGELTQESGRVTVLGRIFAVDTRDIKNNTLMVVSFDMTDGTGSVRASSILKTEEGKKLKSVLEKGKTVRVRGDVEFNRFEKDIVMRPYDINEVELKDITDDASEKRVELHLHTTMSSMDGITSVEEYIKRAAQWGHKAMAVTDHGVVQAFPEAMSAAKKHGIKILYGVEAYFINDSIPAVFGQDKRSLDDEFVVFDLETTGLNPQECGITEIGAVKIKGGKVIDTFNSFVNPQQPIPRKITELTGITNEMVADAPLCDEALSRFYAFCGNAVLVAHNASFDTGFLKVWSQKCGLNFTYSYIDTVRLSRFLFPELKKHKLDVIVGHLKLGEFEHHRACDDAKILSLVFFVMLKKLKEEQGISSIDQINGILSGANDYKRAQAYHQTIFVKNQTGLKNLYKLISYSHLHYYHKRPRILKSLLLQHREGLIIGSACDSGELYVAVREGRPFDEIVNIAKFYDYLEIQPIENSMHLVESGRVSGTEQLKEINKTICQLGQRLGKPVVATGDVHFLEPKDEIFRRVLMAGMGFSDADRQAPLYYRTTKDMLEAFSYLGHEKAYEVVVTNTQKIADWCEEVRPISPDKCPPQIENAPEELVRLSREKAYALYGDQLPSIVEERMQKELDSIINNGFSVMYIISQKLVQKSLMDGYLVGSRGSVGSSFVAYLSGITEVNSLCPHYVCEGCKYSEFVEDGSFGTGVDMPDKNCPKCGQLLKKDGFDIPFETFLGFDGDKEPDIDLNFSGEYQSQAHKYTEVLFGEGYVFRAGTIGTLADKTAYGYVKKYLDERGKVVSRAEENRLTIGCTGIKRTTGQHPGGVIIVPKDREIFDFCPIQRPADDATSQIITTHFDYHSIDKNLLKLDILGHDDPTMIRMLEDLTGVDARTIPLDDVKTMQIFTSNKSLGIEPDDIISQVGSIAIPEFGTRFVRQMLEDTKPTTFIELINISGLSHGTDVWLNNAQDLVRAGTANLSEIICTRDDIMSYLIHREVPKKSAFSIMESVRKGKGLTPEWEALMEEHKIPKWYINSCKKIKYMFPKAHAVAYVMMAFRIAYFKVHHPEAFYTAYFTVRADEFEAQHMIYGIDTVVTKMKEIAQNPNATTKEKNMMTVLEVCYEMYKRGINFCPIDLYQSEAVRFKITKDGILPPLNALAGLGVTAANNIVRVRQEGEFASMEDLQVRAKLSKTVLDILEESGALQNMPRSSQMCLF
jgi:DNA polymerase-3 subunit alpha (Gram-positive type)